MTRWKTWHYVTAAIIGALVGIPLGYWIGGLL